MLRIEILCRHAKDIVLRDLFDGFWIVRKIIQPQIVELHLCEDIGELGARIDPQREATDDEGLRLIELLIRDRGVAYPFDLGQNPGDGLIRDFGSRLQTDVAIENRIGS
mgnify:CR=1 FL=1